MRLLDGSSAFLIYADQPRNYQHTLKIGFMEASEPYSYQDILDQIRHNNEEYFPFLKWKIANTPMGVNHPYWIEDLDYNISHHVRRIACPAPGDKRAFCNLVSDLYSQPLNKALPLWNMWVVEGLDDGTIAIVSMLHHAYADGVGASYLLNALISPDAYGYGKDGDAKRTSEDYGVNSKKNPSAITRFAHGLVTLPLEFGKKLPVIYRDWQKLRTINKRYQAEGKPSPPPGSSAPRSPFNAALTHGRTFYYDSYDFKEFKSLAKKNRATVNDLLLAVITSAIRAYYLQNQIPIEYPLVAAIPINMRTEENKHEILGNHVSTSTVSLPIHLESPKEILTAVCESANTMKEYVKATHGLSLIRMMDVLPPFVSKLVSWALNQSQGKRVLMGNLAVSNVPGPTQYLTVKTGEKMVDWLSIGQVSSGIALNLTAWRYVDKFNICLMADKAVIPDGEAMFDLIRKAYHSYLDMPEAVNKDEETSAAAETTQ